MGIEDLVDQIFDDVPYPCDNCTNLSVCTKHDLLCLVCKRHQGSLRQRIEGKRERPYPWVLKDAGQPSREIFNTVYYDYVPYRESVHGL